MANYNQIPQDINVHFSKAVFGETESSRMIASPVHFTDFNAGDLIPIYCREILPDESMEMDIDFVIRQSTLLTPTMGNMHIDIYAYFVPNRIVNQSWKAVMGENYNGSWTANSVSLAPLATVASLPNGIKFPVGCIADYYGFPTQGVIPVSVLSQCHDLKFRGYVMIWNERFRDQNYQAPIPMSTLNVYQGFLTSRSTSSTLGVSLDGSVTVPGGIHIPGQFPSDGSFGVGSIKESIYGSGNSGSVLTIGNFVSSGDQYSSFKAYDKPLKANKLHDVFTSVLPSPQKSQSSIFAPVTGNLIFTVPSTRVSTTTTNIINTNQPPLFLRSVDGAGLPNNAVFGTTTGSGSSNTSLGAFLPASLEDGNVKQVFPTNLATYSTDVNADVTGLALSVDDIRMASAIQQVYETLARGGSRYREIVASFFGIEVDDPYSDIPQCLGHISRDLDLYQTAQTAASSEGSTPQGNLAGFGYTSSGGKLFSNHRFIEHGYLHVLAVVRHRNIYCSYLARDNFRLNMLDFYFPNLANISEQPVFAREVNPFCPNPNNAFGYQEAWYEYRFEPDMVSGYSRPQPSGVESFALWNYADDFNSSLQISSGDWLRSNSEEVLNRTLAVTSSVAPQFKAQFKFRVDKTPPMPTYSDPGMDII